MKPTARHNLKKIEKYFMIKKKQSYVKTIYTYTEKNIIVYASRGRKKITAFEPQSSL